MACVLEFSLHSCRAATPIQACEALSCACDMLGLHDASTFAALHDSGLRPATNHGNIEVLKQMYKVLLHTD